MDGDLQHPPGAGTSDAVRRLAAEKGRDSASIEACAGTSDAVRRLADDGADDGPVTDGGAGTSDAVRRLAEIGRTHGSTNRQVQEPLMP